MRRRPHPRPLMFQTHALHRFVKRRPDLFLPGAPTPDEGTVARMAWDNYRLGQMLGLQEARRMVGGLSWFWRNRNRIYRAAADGRGVWMATWDGNREKVLSFLIRRRSRTWPLPHPIPLRGRRKACA